MENNKNILNELYKIKLDKCEFSVRVYNCLKRAGILNVAQIIINYNKLHKIRNLGKLSLDEIYYFLINLSNMYNIDILSLAEQYSNDVEYINDIGKLDITTFSEDDNNIDINNEIDYYTAKQEFFNKYKNYIDIDISNLKKNIVQEVKREYEQIYKQKYRQEYKDKLQMATDNYNFEIALQEKQLAEQEMKYKEMIKSYFPKHIENFNQFFNQLNLTNRELLLQYLKNNMEDDIKNNIKQEFNDYKELQKRNIDNELEKYKQEQLNQIKNKTDQEINMYLIGRLSTSILNNSGKTGIKINKIGNNINITYLEGGENNE